MERILTEVVPREALHVLFGGIRTGGQDMAGISGASKYDHGGGRFQDTAITDWLKGLDFTRARVSEIAAQIDLRDPAAFLQWLTGIVGVVVGFRDLKKVAGMDLTATVQDIEKEQNRTAVESFTARA